jgi:hypothetical protein
MPPTRRHWRRPTGLRRRASPPLRGAWPCQEGGRMTYPSAPWTLRGHAVHTLRLVDRVQARAFVPSGLEIVSVLPGRTLGGVYLAAYGPGSALPYHE